MHIEGYSSIEKQRMMVKERWGQPEDLHLYAAGGDGVQGTAEAEMGARLVLCTPYGRTAVPEFGLRRSRVILLSCGNALFQIL